MRRRADEIAAEIVRNLDIAAEFRALGLRLVGSGSPNSKGWVSAHAWGREDSDPSAGICTITGRYKDLGGEGTNLSLWDFAAWIGRFPDWRAARDHYAEKAGVPLLPQIDDGRADSRLLWLDWSDSLASLWCDIHKPGVTPEAILAFGGRFARYRDRWTVIAIPVFSYAGRPGEPVGWTIFPADGQKLPVFGRDKKPHWVKMKTTAGSQAGWIGKHALERLAGARRIWKTEGPTDAMALWAAIPPADRDREVVLTNSQGASEYPSGLDTFAGKDVVILHDCDSPGQRGAVGHDGRLGWARAAASKGSSARNLVLPYAIEAKHGKDVRDWLIEGHTFAELTSLAAGIEAEKKSSITPSESEDDPHRLARLYLSRYATDEATGLKTLAYWREEWHRWIRNAWRSTPEADLRADVTRAVKEEFDRINLEELDSGQGKDVRRITRKAIGDVLGALASMVSVPYWREQPTWMIDGPWPENEVLATGSGILHLPSVVSGEDCIVPPTPGWFSSNAVPYEFTVDPPEPVRWFRFLRSLWHNDTESIEAIQQWFGYCLLPETHHHKILMLVGPKRSGKSTLVRILTALVGDENTVSPKLSSLGSEFGMWPLLGKTLAICNDVRISRRSDIATITETLLGISGEDRQTIARKGISSVTTRLRCRFVLTSNDLPGLDDSSGALASRMILLRTTESFYGREDKHLEESLLEELPSILHWAIDGWDLLRRQGHFTEPSSSRDLQEQLYRYTSPINAFVSDYCVLGPHNEVSSNELYKAWGAWLKANGFGRPGNSGNFGRQLHSAIPRLRSTRSRSPSGERTWYYVGIGLRSEVRETISDDEQSVFGREDEELS